MRDFTLQSYETLLLALQRAGYEFFTFEQYLSRQPDGGRYVILRHDVDLRPDYSLRTAQIEQRLGIAASYYVRVVKQSFAPRIIRQIAALGHEIGYHYEDLSLADGNMEKAKQHFETWLAELRRFYPVKTICMHGAPTSKWDGRDMWKNMDYRCYGIIGEPYFDIDFSKCFYLTDTGRCWDGYKVSLRDKIRVYQDEWIKQGWTYHHTFDIICSIEQGTLPKQLMITTHPQRWSGEWFPWLQELLTQTIKNSIKRILVLCRHK